MTHGVTRVVPDDPHEVQCLGHGWVLTFSHLDDGSDTWWLMMQSTVSDVPEKAAAEVPATTLGPLAEWMAARATRRPGSSSPEADSASPLDLPAPVAALHEALRYESDGFPLVASHIQDRLDVVQAEVDRLRASHQVNSKEPGRADRRRAAERGRQS